MNEEIRALVESLRRGQYEDPAEKIALLTAALQEHSADIQLLESLFKAPQIALRLAALEACHGRTEPELVKELVKLADDPESRVREKLPRALDGRETSATLHALRCLTQDVEAAVRKAAIGATGGIAGFREIQQTLLESDPDWEVRMAAAIALATQRDPIVAFHLFKALAEDDDKDISQKCGELIEKRLLANRTATEKQLPQEISLLSRAEGRLKNLGGERFRHLLTWITTKTSIEADPKVLASFGTDLTAQALQKELPRGYCLESSCVTVLRLLRREKWRSLALLGPAGSGKTALVNELVYRLAEPENGSWRVIRISPADFMAGTRYLGDWETKLRNLIEAARNPRRVVIYVPNLGDLSGVGSTDQSSNNIASALAPYLEDGSILLIGESTPEEFERGLGSAPTLKRLFDTVLVEEADTGQTLEILSAVRDEQNINLSDETLPRLLETAGQFLSHVSRPGNAVMLLRGVAQISKEAGRPVNLRDILDSLSKSTGVPADILDDSIPLNQGELRQWFERRIMGQAEAVDSVIDLVTLIKAGLTDPTKPFGVFLFIGPTGVGKTVLAKALAEFIFGNPDRLKRFDMSEFASYEGFTRLIGKDNQPGLLTEAIRQHPFSVVLLDEIEKSHQNVFDLCLQIFDAGRLTDGQGRTVDFRRTIIILTSNIGAAVPTVSVGFHSGGTALPPESDKDRTVRELTRFFRPEFLNRIDRIVQFRPLSL